MLGFEPKICFSFFFPYVVLLLFFKSHNRTIQSLQCCACGTYEYKLITFDAGLNGVEGFMPFKRLLLT